MYMVVGFVGLLFVSGATSALTATFEYGCLVFGIGMISYAVLGRRM